MPKISIIIPVYNTEKYIERCILSILNQSFIDFECIIVDDGSKDGSIQICNDYAARDNRIRIISQKNMGASYARENGLKYAKGNYIYFCDSDDYLHCQLLELLYSAITQGFSIAYCGFQRVYETEQNTQTPKYDNTFRVVQRDDLFNNWHTVEMNVLWNKLFRKEVLDEIQFPHGIIYEDEFVKPQIFNGIEAVAEIDYPLYFYQQRCDSVMRTGFTIKRLDKIVAVYQSVIFFRHNGLFSYFEEELEYFSFYYFRYFFQAMYQNIGEDLLYPYKQYYNKVFWWMIRCRKFSLKYKYMLAMYRFFPNIAEKRYGASYRAEK